MDWRAHDSIEAAPANSEAVDNKHQSGWWMRPALLFATLAVVLTFLPLLWMQRLTDARGLLDSRAAHAFSTGGATDKGVAFFVQTSVYNVDMVAALMERIYHPQNPYLIHFDTDIPDELVAAAQSGIAAATRNASNVEYLEPRETIQWAGLSLLLNLLSGVAVLTDANLPWTHLILTAPTNVPLVSPAAMRDILAEVPQQSFISIKQYREKQWYVKKMRLKMKTIRTDPAVFGFDQKFFVSGELPWPAFADHEFSKGELWLVLSYNDAVYATSSARAHRMLVRMISVFAPDEWYFPTIMAERERLRMSAKVDEVGAADETDAGGQFLTPVNDALLYLAWGYPGANETTGHPFFLDEPDLFYDEIAKSGALFARKFNYRKNGCRRLVQMIDTNLIGNSRYEELVRKRISVADSIASTIQDTMVAARDDKYIAPA